MTRVSVWFYGLAHHCDILIPELNVETYLNQEHKKKKMNEQKDVAGIFLTSTPEAIMYTALFYGLAHHCDILIPELNVETYLNQEHKKKKMNEQKDVAGIFLTSTPEAIMYTALFYGLAHHCDILIPELNVETYLNQEHKKKKMNEQKDVAGIFLTSTPEAIMYTAL
ncbi:hypothetical protein QYM36_004665 [Artemia franciscana]|uniref:Uncharacterized protein n=1 Tax=Artemia franciscana TaxID=6661 RepID=A0AA88I460_ARTSF|nr:hypothetical protein QYM36_004665 [Artemia franciscana]